MLSDAEILSGALPRIGEALRTRSLVDARSGTTLTSHQLRLLAALDADDPAMVGELAEFMGVTASTMSLNIGRLEAIGLVTRSRDPEDRRVTNVRLSESGVRARRATALVDPDRVDALLSLLGSDQRRRAVDGLSILAEAADRLTRRGGEHIDALSSAP